MVEDNNNNDTKEELGTSSDDKNMDTQQIDENKDLQNIKVDKKEEITDIPKEEQGDNVEDKNEKKADETEGGKLEEQKVLEEEEKKPEVNQEKEENPDAKWYVVGAASTFEERAVKTIQDNARKASLSHFFFDFQIPKQEVIEMKRGKKINSKKNFFPGYMLIKMIMNNQTWQLVKNSNKVSGFTGNDHKPIPLSQNEAMKMLKKADDSIEYVAPKYIFEVGQQVKVIDGPFASFNGMVEEVDDEKGRLKISVSIFGRSTPVELEYTQVEKI